MALPTLVVKDGNNVEQTINTMASGRQDATDSSGVALSSEDYTALTSILAELTDILAALNTPASELPPPVPVGVGNTALTRVDVDISTASTHELLALSGSTTIRVHKGVLVIGGANVLQFQSNGVDIGGPLTFGSAGGSINFDDPVYAEIKGAASQNLQLVTSTTAAVGGWLWVVQD